MLSANLCRRNIQTTMSYTIPPNTYMLPARMRILVHHVVCLERSCTWTYARWKGPVHRPVHVGPIMEHPCSCTCGVENSCKIRDLELAHHPDHARARRGRPKSSCTPSCTFLGHPVQQPCHNGILQKMYADAGCPTCIVPAKVAQEHVHCQGLRRPCTRPVHSQGVLHRSCACHVTWLFSFWVNVGPTGAKDRSS